MHLRIPVVYALLSIALTAGAHAQVPFGGSRIALIDTGAFYDPTKGIRKLTKAYAELNKEFKAEHDTLEAQGTRYRGLKREIEELEAQLTGRSGGRPPDRRAVQASIKSKNEEAARLGAELQRKQDDAKDRYSRREKVVTEPIKKDIGEALEAFRKKNNYDMILDLKKMMESMLSANPALDITAAFIKEYNAKP